MLFLSTFHECVSLYYHVKALLEYDVDPCSCVVILLTGTGYMLLVV